MNGENKENFKKFALLTRHDIGETEESVKINFVVPLLECFGHKRLDFEHKYTDILIKKGLADSVIVETKNYDKNLDRELEQLERYCHKERPLLGLIANGLELRIYSYSWRFRKVFQDHLIYNIAREKLGDENIIQRIEKILSRNNLKTGRAKDYVIEREQEIENAGKDIQKIEEELNNENINLQKDIDKLNYELESIQKQIEGLSERKKGIATKKEEQISEVWQAISFQPPMQPSIMHPPSQHVPSDLHISDGPSYISSYRKQLNNPNSLPSKIRRYIEEHETITLKDLKRACVEKFGCRSETSGSIGASVKVLEVDGYIKMEGHGNNKRLISIEKR